jgi:hypothetical protein
MRSSSSQGHSCRSSKGSSMILVLVYQGSSGSSSRSARQQVRTSATGQPVVYSDQVVMCRCCHDNCMTQHIRFRFWGSLLILFCSMMKSWRLLISCVCWFKSCA